MPTLKFFVSVIPPLVPSMPWFQTPTLASDAKTTHRSVFSATPRAIAVSVAISATIKQENVIYVENKYSTVLLAITMLLFVWSAMLGGLLLEGALRPSDVLELRRLFTSLKLRLSVSLATPSTRLTCYRVHVNAEQVALWQHCTAPTSLDALMPSYSQI